METDRLEQQLSFLIECDKMKKILRRTVLMDSSRRENDAEHSWHFALMAMTLLEYAGNKDLDTYKVLRMALVHDLIEIYAGDTFAYDPKGHSDKYERETAAADKLFSLLPEDQGKEFRSLWEEFDAMETPEAQYAASIDRFQPFLHNYRTQGYTWKEGNVHYTQVYERMEILRTAMPALWPTVLNMMKDSVEKGYLLP